MEGWLIKYGCGIVKAWRRRWCKLHRASLVLSADAAGRYKRISLELLPCSRATAFVDPGAPAQARRLAREMPFGFVLDINPSADDKARQMFYFDAGDLRLLHKWVAGITAAVGSWTLQLGDAVTVTRPMFSDSYPPAQLQEGQSGIIMEFDDCGDAYIDMDCHKEYQWIRRHKFGDLRKIAENDEKSVALEVIPQNELINHWAVRVGDGQAARIYEFDADGVHVGRRTVLNRGYKMVSNRLEGTTNRSNHEILSWCIEFNSKNRYEGTGEGVFGGKNCQDFAVELCVFLGLNASQLPWRQANIVKTATAAGAVVATDAALGTGVLVTAVEALGTGAAAAAGVALAPQLLAAGVVVGSVGVMTAAMMGLTESNSSASSSSSTRSDEKGFVSPVSALPPGSRESARMGARCGGTSSQRDLPGTQCLMAATPRLGRLRRHVANNL